MNNKAVALLLVVSLALAVAQSVRARSRLMFMQTQVSSSQGTYPQPIAQPIAQPIPAQPVPTQPIAAQPIAAQTYPGVSQASVPTAVPAYPSPSGTHFRFLSLQALSAHDLMSLVFVTQPFPLESKSARTALTLRSERNPLLWGRTYVNHLLFTNLLRCKEYWRWLAKETKAGLDLSMLKGTW